MSRAGAFAWAVLSLPHRLDRREILFPKLEGLSPQLVWSVSRADDAQSAAMACFASHIHALECYSQDSRDLIVLEDDADPVMGWQPLLENLSIPEDAGFVVLGCSGLPHYSELTPKVRFSGTHAMLYPAKHRKRLLAGLQLNSRQTGVIEDLFRETCHNLGLRFYVTGLNIFDTAASYSDRTGSVLSPRRRAWTW